MERARYATRSYQATEGQPMPIRRAEMLRDLARQTPIAIYADERIVGNRSLLPRMGVIAPEGAVDWIDRELEILPTRPQDQFNITPEEIETLRRDVPLLARPYAGGYVAARVPAHHARPSRRLQPQPDRPRPGPHPARCGRLAAVGHQWAARTGAGSEHAPATRSAVVRRPSSFSTIFYEAADRAATPRADAPLRPARRRCRRAEADPARRCELAGSPCAAAGWPAPRADFIEALQAIWFLFVLLQMESNASSFSPGRLDQYLLPYLEATSLPAADA